MFRGIEMAEGAVDGVLVSPILDNLHLVIDLVAAKRIVWEMERPFV